MEPWNRLPDEIAIWYARFEAYRTLGPNRSIDEAYRVVSGFHKLSGKRPGQAWYKAAERWQWRERAEAWDDTERKRLQAIEQTRRWDAREERLRIIQEQLNMVTAVIATADAGSLTVDEAREMLPTMRLLLRDLLAAQRIELGLPVVESGGDEVLPFTADELAKASEALRAEGYDVTPMRSPMGPTPSRAAADSFTLSLTTALAKLYPDELSSRRVAGAAGVDVATVRFGSAMDSWYAIVQEAQYAGCMESLLRVVQREYESSQELRQALKGRGVHA